MTRTTLLTLVAASTLLPMQAHAQYALTLAEYDRSADPVAAPRMARWQPLVWRIVGKDPQAFAQVMTFILVESGGHQFAISRSGCVGLMQFCDGTAIRPPFDTIFKPKELRSCACAHRRCKVNWQVRRFLETSPQALHSLVQQELPCVLSDPRFDPEQSIRAGARYIKDLAQPFENNLYLIYIGYNSGPHVAERVAKKLGPRKAKRLKAIAKVLRKALAPNFGKRAKRRARSLLDVHLPKAARVYQAFLRLSSSTKSPTTRQPTPAKNDSRFQQGLGRLLAPL